MNSEANIQLEVKQALLEDEMKEQRERLSSDRMDISFGELINLYRNKELIVRPEYQRLYRWSSEQKTSLIESILLSIPVPPIFVSEDSEGIWELVDGLQRIVTIVSFFGFLDDSFTDVKFILGDEYDETDDTLNNKWCLEEGDLLKNLSGFTIDTLPTQYVLNIKRSVCRVEILRGESNTKMKYELFKRLNSGGSILKPQEIRNAIYRGIDTRLNILLEKLSKLEVYRNLVLLSSQKKQELYDQELVLKFIAYYENIESINKNTEKYLDDFMNEAVNNNEFDYEKYEKVFTDTINLISKCLDDRVFRNDMNNFVPGYFEGIMVGVAQNYSKYKENEDLLKDRVEKLKKDDSFKRYSGSASNSKSRAKNRLRRAVTIFSEK